MKQTKRTNNYDHCGNEEEALEITGKRPFKWIDSQPTKRGIHSVQIGDEIDNPQYASVTEWKEALAEQVEEDADSYEKGYW